MKSAAPIRIWRAPVALAALTAFGLSAALVVDGAADAASWVALAVPLVVVSWFASPRVQRRRAGPANLSPRLAMDGTTTKEVPR